MNNLFKGSLIAVAIVNALTLPGVYAQEAERENAATQKTENVDDVEKIEIRGFGASLGKALREKRFADSVVEVISSDDLGLLPDVSITDSLVRLPGVAASIDRGNASRISIRGMGPRLNAATMNNREIVTAEPSRDVRFEQFPAELIDSVQVYKSPIASRAEGGISGLVNMDFVSPLSRDKRKISVSGDFIKNSLGDDIPGADGNGHKLSFGYIDQLSDTFGIALGLTYQDQPSISRGVQSWNYNTGDNRGDLNENGIPEDAPWGMTANASRGNNERIGGLAVIEWKPSQRLSLKGDLFYSQNDIGERGDSVGPGRLGNWADGGSGPRGYEAWPYDQSSVEPTIITKADGTEQIVAGSQLNNGLDNAVATWFQTNELLSTGINSIYAGDTWKVTADVGYSEASIESVWVRITPTYVGGDYDLGFDVSNGTPEIIVHSGDISSPENYSLGAVSEVWYETSPGVWEPTNEFAPSRMDADGDRRLTDEMYNINLDFERDVELGIFETLSFGGRYTDRTKENNQIQDWSRFAIQDHGLTDYGMSYSIGSGYNAPEIYTFKNWDEVAIVAFGGSNNPGDRSNKDLLASWELNETNSAAYAMFNMSGDIGEVNFTGNLGLRYVKTEVESIGHEQGTQWTQDSEGNWNPPSSTPVVVHHDYDEWLPSLNMIFFITDDSQIRFGLARTMARPPLLEMRTGFEINNSATPPTANGGNPTLDPYIANQLDLGYEYFWGNNSAATINFFYKDLKSHIGIASGTVNFEGEEYAFTGTVNGDGGTIKGFEILYAQAFDMLPAPFDGLGVFANYSYTDSDVMEFKPVGNPYNLGGLSEDVASLTLWYSKYDFDVRLSYNYRSEYTGINSWNPSDVNLNDDQSTVNASIGYQVTENFKLTLQAQNLTNESSVNYWDNDRQKPASHNVEWGRRFLIGFQFSL
jgi:iron complex outermembrane receptor protein